MSIEQKSTAPVTKERLGTIPRQGSGPEAPIQRRKDGPARVAKVIIGFSVTATIGALAAAALGGVGDSSPTLGAYGSLANNPTAASVANFPMNSGDLRLDGLLVRPDSFTGDFDGVVRMTWTGAEAIAGSQAFSVEVRKDGREVAQLTGAVADVAPGQSLTLHVASNDRFVSGPLQFALGAGVSTMNQAETVNLLNGLAAVQSLEARANGDVAMAMAGETGDAGHSVAEVFAPLNVSTEELATAVGQNPVDAPTGYQRGPWRDRLAQG